MDAAARVPDSGNGDDAKGSRSSGRRRACRRRIHYEDIVWSSRPRERSVKTLAPSPKRPPPTPAERERRRRRARSSLWLCATTSKRAEAAKVSGRVGEAASLPSSTGAGFDCRWYLEGDRRGQCDGRTRRAPRRSWTARDERHRAPTTATSTRRSARRFLADPDEQRPDAERRAVAESVGDAHRARRRAAAAGSGAAATAAAAPRRDRHRRPRRRPIARAGHELAWATRCCRRRRAVRRRASRRVGMQHAGLRRRLPCSHRPVPRAPPQRRRGLAWHSRRRLVELMRRERSAERARMASRVVRRRRRRRRAETSKARRTAARTKNRPGRRRALASERAAEGPRRTAEAAPNPRSWCQQADAADVGDGAVGGVDDRERGRRLARSGVTTSVVWSRRRGRAARRRRQRGARRCAQKQPLHLTLQEGDPAVNAALL